MRRGSGRLTKEPNAAGNQQIVDAFLVSSFMSAVVQFLYMMIVGTFPFNSFLAGFLSSVGFFVLTVCLRMQVNPNNPEFADVSDESAFFDYVLSNVLLHLVVFNFIG